MTGYELKTSYNTQLIQQELPVAWSVWFSKQTFVSFKNQTSPKSLVGLTAKRCLILNEEPQVS
jgi:hypothetical protein